MDRCTSVYGWCVTEFATETLQTPKSWTTLNSAVFMGLWTGSRTDRHAVRSCTVRVRGDEDVRGDIAIFLTDANPIDRR